MEDSGDPNWLAAESMLMGANEGELLEDDFDNAETFGDMEEPVGEFDFEQGNREFSALERANPPPHGAAPSHAAAPQPQAAHQDLYALNDFDPSLGKDFGINRQQEFFKDPEMEIRMAQKNVWNAHDQIPGSTWSFQGGPVRPSGFPAPPPGFQQQPQQPPRAYPPAAAAPAPAGPRMMSVEELEQRFQTVSAAPQVDQQQQQQQAHFAQQQQQQQFYQQQQRAQQQHPHPQQQQYPPHQQQRGPWGGNQGPNRGSAQMSQIIQEEQAQYEKRLKQNAAFTRQRSYNGLMTFSDKKLITKIQLLQLQTENPYLDDFYFHTFSKRAMDPNAQLHSLPKLKPLPFTKPKLEAVTAEGALGIIPRHSVNRPRMLVQLQGNSQEAAEGPKEVKNPLDNKPRTEKVLSKTKQIKVLKTIEAVYDTILALEDINHQLTQLPEEERPAKFEQMAHLVHLIEVQITTPVEGMTKEDFILHFVRYPKGPKILKRALPLLSNETLSSYFFSLLKVFDQLNILDPQSSVEHVAAFLRGVMQPLGPIIEQLNLAKLNAAMEIIVNHSLFGVFSMARSKVGLTLFEMLLVRAEQIKLSEHPEANELAEWRRQFGVFFALMESNYTSLLTITEQFLSSEIWTFFILLSMHSSPDQRFALLSEIRDRVMEVVRSNVDPAAKQPVFQLLLTMGINPQDLQ